VNICYRGHDIWIELKIVSGRKVDLRPEQVAWHHRRTRAGGVSWIMARDKADGVRKGKYDRIYLWPGSAGAAVKMEGIAAKGGTCYESPFEWDTIMSELFEVIW